MIQPELAILLWVPVAAGLMLDRNPARGFSIALLGALLLLPSGITADALGVPQLSKTGAVGIGILVGASLFHSRLVLQFRPRWFDGLLVVMLGAMIYTSWRNGLGVYDGVSSAVVETLNLLTIWLGARIVLYRPEGLKTFLLGVVFASAVYTPLAMWEWRMSPQLHSTLYGEFQHQFAQFHRWGFFRPVVCFPHALDLGRFMAFAAFLALMPLRRDLARLMPGGGWLFVAPMLALVLSMSLGPYLIFAGLCVSFVLLKSSRLSWAVYAIPACALVFVVMLAGGANPYDTVFQTARTIDADRADSFQYRIDALEEYQGIILERPWFGHGGWSRGRLSHRATDSDLLIRMLKFGFVGAGLYFLWWGFAMGSFARLLTRMRQARFGRIVRAMVAALAIALAISTIDRALDPQIVVAVSSLVGIDAMIRRGKLAAPPRPAVTNRASTSSRTATA